VISALPAVCGGVKTAICVELSFIAPTPNVVPNFTLTDDELKFEPLMTTRVPPAMVPELGESENAEAASVVKV
jgi:hypothetical protein